jgi:hypothetical protein
MPKLISSVSVILLALAAMGESRAQAPSSTQQDPSQQSTQPVQPVKPVQDAPGKKNPDDGPVSPVVAGSVNNAPLTGATEQRRGPLSSRSYFSPGVEYYGQLDSNGSNTNSGRFVSFNSILGSLALQRMGRGSQFNLDYLGGRSFSPQNGNFNSTTQELGVSGLMSRGRWEGFLADRFSYSSQSAFLGGITPFDATEFNDVYGLAPSGPVILRDTFLPGNGVFTNFGPRLSNAIVGQVTDHVSRRAFFTGVANFNTLHFFNSGLINTSAAGFQVGAGYQRTREDAIAAVYRFDDLWFSGSPDGIADHAVEAVYQHQRGERLLFQAGAGPEISFIHAPTQTAGGASRTRISWTADVSAHYQFTRTSGVAVGYDHLVTGGGGVFLGASSNRAYFELSRELSRPWLLTFNASYARNANLIPLFVGTTSVPAGATFNSAFGGFEAKRRIGRDSSLFFGYTVRYQTAQYILCPSGVCIGSDFVGHQINFGFVWRLKPIPLD